MKIHYSKQKIRSILLFLIFLGLGVLILLGYLIFKRLQQNRSLSGESGNVSQPKSPPLNPANATPEQKIDILKNLSPSEPSQNLSQKKKLDILKQLAPQKTQQRSKGSTAPIQDMSYAQKKKILEQLSHK